MSICLHEQCAAKEARTGSAIRGFASMGAAIAFMALACVLAVAPAGAGSAYADDASQAGDASVALDSDQARLDASLTLEVVHDSDSPKAQPIDGMTLAAYQVAIVNANGAYELVDDFSNAEVDFNREMTASQANDAAAAMAKIASGVGVAQAVTDASGIAEFGTLEWGVYLIVQTGAAGTAEGYNELAPFLINVPQFNTEVGNVFDVVSHPKPELKPEKPDEPDKPDKPDQPENPDKPNTPSKPPETGDSIQAITIAGIGIGCVAAFVIALMAFRRMRGSERK